MSPTDHLVQVKSLDVPFVKAENFTVAAKSVGTHPS